MPEPSKAVPLLAEGTAALDRVDAELGLAFDAWDKQYYYDLFVYAPVATELLARLVSLAAREWDICRPQQYR